MINYNQNNIEFNAHLNVTLSKDKVYDDPSELALEILKEQMASGVCDLHIHSNSSAGSDSVGEIFKKAMENGLHCFALTDYDTMAGVNNTFIIVEKLVKLGVKTPNFIRGIEISAVMNEKKQNLLAYFPVVGSGAMYDFLECQRLRRRQRNEKMCAKLQEHGLEVTIEELENEGSYVVGRIHAANILVRKGQAVTIGEVFYQWLNKGRPCYVDYELPNIELCISKVREAGGVPVLSKPYFYGWNDWSDEEIIAKLQHLKTVGLMGVEVVYGTSPVEFIDRLANCSNQVGLLNTSGSGYRGFYRRNSEMFRGDQDFSRWIKVD